jgi:hypothetical protein
LREARALGYDARFGDGIPPLTAARLMMPTLHAGNGAGVGIFFVRAAWRAEQQRSEVQVTGLGLLAVGGGATREQQFDD